VGVTAAVANSEYLINEPEIKYLKTRFFWFFNIYLTTSNATN
jgi:hypothetical protein